MKAAVVGLGRAGLPLAAVMADVGVEVVGVDVDPKRVDDVNAGVNPIPEEQGLTELLQKHGGAGIKATVDINDARECTVYVVIVPLFLDDEHRPDFSAIEDAFKKISTVLSDGDLVVLETTVPPGTSAGLVKDILDGSGRKYHLAYSPERIMTGVSISRFREFPKVVGGLTPEATDKAYNFYSQFSETVVRVGGARTAELVKVAEGIYRDVNIALANELYMVCEQLGADYWEVREAARHEFCDLHEPGMVGGHCIPVYPWFLLHNHEVPLIRLARKLNDDMVGYYADKAKDIAGEGGKVGVVGLSYRAGVREARHTRAHALIKALQDRGLEVYGLDPLFTGEEVQEYFKVKPLVNPEDMDAIVLSYPVEDVKLAGGKTVDVKNTLK
jgi:UDP-N-acetyl-D-mannosaminuronic acid dehydrogenase